MGELIDAINTNNERRNCATQKEYKNALSTLFEMTLYDRIHECFFEKHLNLLQENMKYNFKQIYCPDIHYPLLLVLEKKREYSELLDTVMAIKHVSARKRKK